jgi:hypothetical protein
MTRRYSQSNVKHERIQLHEGLVSPDQSISATDSGTTTPKQEDIKLSFSNIPEAILDSAASYYDLEVDRKIPSDYGKAPKRVSEPSTDYPPQRPLCLDDNHVDLGLMKLCLQPQVQSVLAYKLSVRR